MAKELIPNYDLAGITGQPVDYYAGKFSAYLAERYGYLQHMHRHNFYHLVLFTAGAGNHTIDFRQYPVKTNQVYFMTPGQVHAWNFSGEPDGFIINFSPNLFPSILLNPDYLEKLSLFSGIEGGVVCNISKSLAPVVNRLFEDLLSIYKEKPANHRDLFAVTLLQLLLRIENECTGAPGKAVTAQRMVTFQQFRKLINRHYRTEALPKAYAEMLYITPNHLNALCQDITGKTAGELIRDRILLEAKRLLVNGEHQVSTIADSLSFRDNSYFSRFFKKYAGVSPEEFRRKHRQNIQV